MGCEKATIYTAESNANSKHDERSYSKTKLVILQDQSNNTDNLHQW
jgi:hypothetical protein